MRLRHIGWVSAAIVLVCLALGGCWQPTRTGTLTLNLTDAPGDYDEVFITFTQVSVHKACDNASTPDNATIGDNATADCAGEWIVISTEEQGYDLLTLQDGAFDLLAAAELEVGHYSQIRLQISDGLDNASEPKTYVMVGGVKHALEVPSGDTSGLKLTHGFDITADNETELFLDFDADKSVHQTGAGQYKLQPTIKVLAVLPAAQD